MMGTRRAGVSVVAAKFQNEGLIEYQRGVITIRNRGGLEGTAWECYEIVKQEFKRLYA